MTKERVFIAYWDCLGFETIIDCTSWERQTLLNQISGKELKPAPINLHAMLLRARFNPQRGPEIWSFTTTEEITEAELKEIAQKNPQQLVDLVRERGKCLYRSVADKQIVV